jgi:hypothetical protein
MPGTRPDRGFQLVDGEWLRQLANGNNLSFANGITALAGGTQAPALQLSANPFLIEVDTVATTADSVLLPFSAAGEMRAIFNNGANTLDIYANPNNNPLTGSPDVINKTTNPTAYLLTTGQAAIFFCAKNGVWAAVKSA